MGNIGLIAVSISTQNVPSQLLVLLLLLPAAASGDCMCDPSEATGHNKAEALKFKLAAVASILIAGAFGVSLPLLAKRIPALRPESHIFLMVKAFAAGVILATGFVHIQPEAFDSLRSPCLAGGASAWRNFPFAGLFAMGAAIVALIVDAFAAGLYKRKHFGKDKHPTPAAASVLDEERAGEHAGHVHVHTHATHGHAHGAADPPEDSISAAELIRNRIVSQVLELGIVVHSVIIGISLGASGSSGTVKPLMAALSFHQFFEGMGLGGCISQARFGVRSMAIMSVFFSLTTPVGIGVGIGIASVYKENSPTALIVEGAFNSASAGILIYMALVDLLAADFMSPKLQSNARLHLGAAVSLLLGAASMSLLAKWA